MEREHLECDMAAFLDGQRHAAISSPVHRILPVQFLTRALTECELALSHRAQVLNLEPAVSLLVVLQIMVTFSKL